MANDAGRLILAIDAATISGQARAGQGGEWAVDQPDHLAKMDLTGCLGERVTAVLAAKTLHEAVPLQFQEDKLQELARHSLLGGDFGDSDRFIRLGLGEIKQ